jgi:hypothetical protein
MLFCSFALHSVKVYVTIISVSGMMLEQYAKSNDTAATLATAAIAWFNDADCASGAGINGCIRSPPGSFLDALSLLTRARTLSIDYRGLWNCGPRNAPGFAFLRAVAASDGTLLEFGRRNALPFLVLSWFFDITSATHHWGGIRLIDDPEYTLHASSDLV